ncbi:MAG: hypothetical protein KatS3mg129_0288 [Leptospiraceae bacterium]|nr:MAG: hypothetical protein KatS3mg129_0288 [Leptospiraceae bacterium]
MDSIKEQIKNIRLKPILIPPEHGIWGFTIEALLVGYLLSEGSAKPFIGIMMILLPFAKQTLKIYLQDIFAKRTFLRKYIALFFLFIFGIVFLILFYFANQFALYPFWHFIILSFVLGFIAIILEIKGFYQHIITEIIGSFVPICFALSMNTTLEVQPDTIFYITMILGFRNISSIVLTRKLVDFIKYKKMQNFFLSCFVFLLIIFILYLYYSININIFYLLLIYLLLFVMFYYFIQFNIIKKAQQLGWIQIIVGICYIILSIILK